MFRSGDRWRHFNCLDVDIDILKVQYRGPKYVKMRVMYWNRNYKAYCWRIPETITIQLKDFSKWNLVI